jgi:alginate O-acetyltransferase complex protein AlgF
MCIHQRYLAASIVGLTCFAATAPLAQDTGLYGEAIPADAAFVRWIDGAVSLDRAAFGYDFSETEIPSATYVAVSAAMLTGAASGGYYTVIENAAGDVEIVQEPSRDDASKVHLFLLNGGAEAVTLNVAEAGSEVIGATDAMDANARAVNPVTATLAVQQAVTNTVLAKFDVALRRGQNMTFAVIGDEVILIPSAFGPVIRAGS